VDLDDYCNRYRLLAEQFDDPHNPTYLTRPGHYSLRAAADPKRV